MGRGDLELLQPGAKLLVLGLGMLFLGKQDSADATLEVRSWACLGQSPCHLRWNCNLVLDM